MSIFGTIVSKVFGHAQSGQQSPAAGSSPAASPPAAAATPAPTPAAVAPAPVTPMSQAQVEGILSEMAGHYSHDVNWRSSIVDLLAMLGIDNSLAQRKALAQELGYTGDMNDSATMNIWLHKEVMRQLAENGGAVPADLKR